MERTNRIINQMDTSLTLEDVEIFRERTSALFDEAHERAKHLPDNTVQVIPGEKMFTSIQDAIESIHDASQKLQYQVLIGPGTYNERVKTKEYIFVVGAGPDETRINQHGFEDKYVGAIQAMGNGGISQLTINATGPHPDADSTGNFFCIGILVLTPGRYHIKVVNVHATDNGNKEVNVRGISNKTSGQTDFLLINTCTVSATGTGKDSTSVAIEAFNEGAQYDIDLCQITAGPHGSGITSAEKALITVDESTITGQIYALYDMDGNSTITATKCTINGPISPGVIVNP